MKWCYSIIILFFGIPLIGFNLIVGIIGPIRAAEADIVSTTPLWMKILMYVIPSICSLFILFALFGQKEHPKIKFGVSAFLFIMAILMTIFLTISIIGICLVNYEWDEERIEMRIERENGTECCFNYAGNTKVLKDVYENTVFKDCPLVTNGDISIDEESCIDVGLTSYCKINSTSIESEMICNENIQGDFGFMVFIAILELFNIIYCVIIGAYILMRYKDSIVLMFMKGASQGLLE